MRSGTASFRLDDAVVWDAATPDLSVPTSETVYDAEGAIRASVTPPGVPGTDEPLVTTTARDVLGRPTQVTVNAVAGAGTAAADTNLATVTAYDDLGRTQSTTNPKGIVTRFGYDRLGNLTSTVGNYQDGTGAGVATDDDVTSTSAVDALGELTGYCPAAQVFAGGCDPAASGNAQAWHYGYDDAGHLAVQTPPVNVTATALASTRWEYDTGGRLARSCDTSAPGTSCAAGGASVVRTVTQTYDAVGRTTRQDTYAGAQATLALRTDTTYLGDGQPAQTKYSEGSAPTLKDTLDFGYDAAGRPTTVSRGGTTLSAQTWNASGTLASRTDGDGGAVGTSTFGYDWARRLTSVTEPAGFAATAGFSWRADGLIASRSWTAGGGQATFAYDGAKRLTGITEGSLTEDQTYDRAGNVTAESRSLTGVSGDAGGGSQSFRYDALDRVTSTDGLSASANRSFTYDRDGNRRSKTEGTTTFSYEVDRTDELIAVTKGVLTRQTFAYDARGNLTTDVEDGLSTVAYAYDLGNKLTAIDGPGTANDATFAFDALGRFRTMVVGGTATDTYSYAGTTEIVSRIANSLSGSTDSIVSPTGDRLGVKVGTTVNWFLPDLHGDIAASLDAAQTTVTNAIRYDAYGETLATASATGAPAPVGERAWKFQGRLDVSPDGLATPLYDMSARLYTPGLGAFTQADTVIGSAQDPLSMNRFLYAQANPWTLTDPTGHCAVNGSNGGFDLFGSIGNCLAAGAGFVWATGESVVGVGADLAGAAWSVPGHVADVGRCAADEGCRRQTIHDTLMTGAQFAGEIHARGQAVLADPEPAVRRTISKAAFAAAGWVGEEHRKLTTTGGFEGGREAGHIFGTVEAVGLTTVAGGELAGAARTGASALAGSAKLADIGEIAAARAQQLHGLLDPIATRMRTTAVATGLDSLGSRVSSIASSGRRIIPPALRRELADGEFAARGVPGHAEPSAFSDFVSRFGRKPDVIGSSRAPCPRCASWVESEGIRIVHTPRPMGPTRPLSVVPRFFSGVFRLLAHRMML